MGEVGILQRYNRGAYLPPLQIGQSGGACQILQQELRGVFPFLEADSDKADGEKNVFDALRYDTSLDLRTLAGNQDVIRLDKGMLQISAGMAFLQGVHLELPVLNAGVVDDAVQLAAWSLIRLGQGHPAVNFFCDRLEGRPFLLAVEEDKLAGRKGITLDELDTRLDQLIDGA